MAEFEMDFSQFEKDFKKIVTVKMIEAAKKGMAKAGIQLMNDTVMEEPTVPHAEGYLRGSGSVFIQNDLVAKSSHGNNSEASTDIAQTIPKNVLMVTVGFNTPYAARWHEAEPGSVTFQEPSAGVKFLEKKLNSNKETYYKIVTNQIKKAENA